MGKSDPYIFSFYKSFISKNSFQNIGFFGFSSSNNFTSWFQSNNKDFYDRAIDNWEINTFPYKLKKKDNKYDLIICTRVAYFSNNPRKMLSEFKSMLTPGGIILIDWGLGDHWRFDNFKIGWVKNGEHEWAYDKKNKLWSAYISKDVKESPHYKTFEYHCKKHLSDSSLEETIYREVPTVINENDISDLDFEIIREKAFFLWPESPQLYIGLLLRNCNEF